MKHSDKGIGLQELIEGFLFYLQAEGRAPRTHDYYSKLLRHLIDFSRDQGWPTSISQLDARYFRQFLSWIGSRNYEYSPGKGSHRIVKSKPSMAWPYYKAVKRLFNWGIGEGLLQENPVRDIHFKAPPPLPIQPYNLDELKRFLAICELDIKNGASFAGLRHKAMILLFLDFGLSFPVLTMGITS